MTSTTWALTFAAPSSTSPPTSVEDARGRLALLRLRAAAPDPPRDRYPSEVADLWRLDSTTWGILYVVDVECWHFGEVAGLVGLSEEVTRARASRGRRRLSAAITEEATP